MKNNTSLVKAFTDANKELVKTRFVADPKDIYLTYCALALCTIADKMTDTKPENRPCDKCKHQVWPDGDSTCDACKYSYDSQFEENKE